jgi:hypothetical protein
VDFVGGILDCAAAIPPQGKQAAENVFYRLSFRATQRISLRFKRS